MRYVTQDWIWKLYALPYFLRNEHSFCDLAHAAACVEFYMKKEVT